MTYGTSHLLIGGGLCSGEGQEKILSCKGWDHYMKNKNIGGCILSTQPDQQKGPSAKERKKLSDIEKIFPRLFRSLGILQNSYFWSS